MRITDRHKEMPSLTAENEHYWLALYHKLAQLEDAQDDQRLIVMPVKTGRKVYFLHELKCKRILPFVNSGKIKRYLVRSPYVFVEIRTASGAVVEFKVDEYGEKWFDTKQDAEKAFDELPFPWHRENGLEVQN